MGKKPHYITFIKIIAFHYLFPVSFNTFKEDELMHSHFTGYPCEKCQRKFDHGMKTDKASYAGIHLFNRYSSMPASESMNPPFAFNGICHRLSCLRDVLRLCFLDPGHYFPDIIKPLCCQHSIKIIKC